MQHKVTTSVLAGVIVVCAGFAAWQTRSIGQMREQLTALQQQVGNTNTQVLPAPGQLQAQPVIPVTPPVAGSTPSTGNNSLNVDPNGLLGNNNQNDPFADFDRIQQEMMEHMQQLMAGGGFGGSLGDDFFGGNSFGSGNNLGAQQPELNMSEKNDSYVITIPIPENSNAEVSASVKGNELNIEGKITVKNDGSNNGSAFTSSQSSQFARSMSLPPDADADGLTNVTEANQVVITIPKHA